MKSIETMQLNEYIFGLLIFIFAILLFALLKWFFTFVVVGLAQIFSFIVFILKSISFFVWYVFHSILMFVGKRIGKRKRRMLENEDERDEYESNKNVFR